MKIIIFGTGRRYREVKKYLKLENDVEVLAYIDNDKAKWGMLLDGKFVREPMEVLNCDYDKIVLMSEYAVEMKEQLVRLGCSEKKIIHYKDFFAEKSKGDLFCSEKNSLKKSEKTGKTVLIVTGDLGFHGAAVMAFEMAKIAMSFGYMVTLVGTSGQKDFVEEVCKHKIQVFVCKFLDRMHKQNLDWIDNYDLVVVNTFPMVNVALQLAKKRKVMFYLHEVEEIYNQYDYWKEDVRNEINNKNICVFAVSQIAEKNFRNYLSYYGKVERLSPFVKECRGFEKEYVNGEKLRFCIAGGYEERKGQKVLLDAYELLDCNVQQQCEIYFVGRENDNLYTKLICQRIEKRENVFRKGLMKREELLLFFNEIDVVIVPSLEETMSLVAMEAMMCGKVCIVSDNTGIAFYVSQKKNGLCFTTGNIRALAEQMEWCVINRRELSRIGKRARKTYLDNFTVDMFAKEFEKCLSMLQE